MSTSSPLAVGKVIAAALWLTVERRQPLLRATWLPIILLTFCEVIQKGRAVPEAVSFAEVLLLPLLAIPCHRIVYLGASTPIPDLIEHWSLRETKFSVYVVVVALLFMAAHLPAVTWGPALLAGHGPGVDALVWSAPVALLYAFSRVALVFPAIALGEPDSLRAAWRLSRGNGWRLAVVCSLFPLSLNVAPDWLTARLPLLAVLPLIAACFVLALVPTAALTLAYAELGASRGAT